MNAYTNQYQHNQVATASPEQIMLMLYDGAIRFIRRAINANKENDMVEKLQGISKCLAIITEFSNTLDHEIGGKIAEDLDALYHFMMRELNSARKDTTGVHLENVEKILVDLRDTWGQAVDINKRDQASAEQKASGQNSVPGNNQYKSLTTAG
ncbi:flagellar export chaperone FliS [Desulfosediminicola flagellatus]|uniref:flagellar export chaperone FliS n=1 Tax=Desulfosediminicola flagellatus TaxID=2569541 RepID=UPI0010AB827A|nr:flagellar export chaperone FliS [Desulfosediminicola flagellatus]